MFMYMCIYNICIYIGLTRGLAHLSRSVLLLTTEAHPSVLSGGVAGLSFEQIFEGRVLAKIDAFLTRAIETSPNRVPHVVLVPSPRDVTADAVYPTPPFARFRFSDAVAPHVHWAANPARVEIGGVSIATCSLDTLFVLGGAELASPSVPGAPRPDRYEEKQHETGRIHKHTTHDTTRTTPQPAR